LEKCEDKKMELVPLAKMGAEENFRGAIEGEVHLRGLVAGNEGNARRYSIDELGYETEFSFVDMNEVKEFCHKPTYFFCQLSGVG
jgi:hypothetical protein